MSHLPPGQILRNRQGRIRRPTSAYFLWMLQARDRIRRENPHLATIPLMLEAGRQWRNMPRPQKQSWINQAEANRLRYRNLFGRTRYPRAARRRQRLQILRNRQQQLRQQRLQQASSAPAPAATASTPAAGMPASAPAATAPAPAPGTAATAPAPAPGTAATAPAPAPGTAATAPAPAPGTAATAPPPGSSSSAPPISLAPPRVDSN